MTEEPLQVARPEQLKLLEQQGWGNRKLLPQSSVVFMFSGLLFLSVAIAMFLLLGYILYQSAYRFEYILRWQGHQSDPQRLPAILTQRDIYNFYAAVFSVLMPPLLVAMSAGICTLVGFKLLRAAGAVTQYVVPPAELEILAPAIRDGNEKAISEYIRLSSLSGITGTFTKVGLTGLPLATIVLTITLSILGVFNGKFFDLAQLTLGAFIGSYVQKRSESKTMGAGN